MSRTIPATPSWTAGVRREVLPNGLTLLVQRDDSAPVAAVVTHVRAGFFDEPDEWVGLSHVLEHMFFKGTPTRGVGAIARETKALGGYLNASTSYDRTLYYAVLPARNLRQALDIQADALQRATLDADELGRELRVIIEEARRKRDTPSAVAAETVHELLFDRHRIRRWRIGEEAALAQFTATDLRAYYASRYAPERVIVAVVGALAEDAMLAAAREAYGAWPARVTDVPAGPAEPPRTGVRARTLRADVTQADLVVAWRGVPPLDPQETPLDVAAAILAAGRGSRLYGRLREPGIATSVGAWHYAQGDVGVFAVHADGEPARTGAMLDGIAAEVRRLGAEGPGEVELERAVTLLRARWARQFESYEGRASALAGAEALGGLQVLDEEYRRLITVTADEVRTAVAEHLQADRVSVVASLPRDGTPDVDVARVEGAFGATIPPRAVPASAPARPAPAARAATGRVTAEVLHVPLAGADLLVRRKRGIPLVSLGVYAGRMAWETPADAGIGALAVRSALRGAAGLDAAALALACERLGGSFAPVASSDWVGLGLSVLAEHAGEGATLLRDVWTAPALGDAEVETERALLEEEARQQADDMFRYPFQLAFRAAFGARGYGLPVGGMVESVRGLTAAAVRGWHREAVAGVRPVVVAVGDVAPDRLAGELAAAFDLGGVAARPDPREPLAWAGQALPTVERRDKQQSAFAMVFPGPARRDADRPAAEVWAAVASGLGGRLFEALRDRRSLAYTVLATAWPRARGGALATYIATSPAREEEARQQMLAELARFIEAPPTDRELDQARNYLAGQAEVARQSAGAVLAEIVEAWFAGRGLGDLADPGAEYRAVTGAQVLEVARRYLDPARRGEGVVRGVTALAAPAATA